MPCYRLFFRIRRSDEFRWIFKGGIVLGETNETGTEVAQKPVYPQDLIREVYKKLGINPDGPLQNPRGLDVKAAPAAKEGSKYLKEIT